MFRLGFVICIELCEKFGFVGEWFGGCSGRFFGGFWEVGGFVFGGVWFVGWIFRGFLKLWIERIELEE